MQRGKEGELAKWPLKPASNAKIHQLPGHQGLDICHLLGWNWGHFLRNAVGLGKSLCQVRSSLQIRYHKPRLFCLAESRLRFSEQAACINQIGKGHIFYSMGQGLSRQICSLIEGQSWVMSLLQEYKLLGPKSFFALCGPKAQLEFCWVIGKDMVRCVSKWDTLSLYRI